jgi:hypothetical protein
MSIDAPGTINIEGLWDEKKPENKTDEIITIRVKGKTDLISRGEAIDIINQLSGVLLAHEHSGRRQQSKKKYL